MATDFNPGHKEGAVATTIEEHTAKLPSDVFFVDSDWSYCSVSNNAINWQRQRKQKPAEQKLVLWTVGSSVFTSWYLQQACKAGRSRLVRLNGIKKFRALLL